MRKLIRSLTRSILEDPYDDLPRLALADLLLEKGSEWGKFVHLQMAREARKELHTNCHLPRDPGGVCKDCQEEWRIWSKQDNGGRRGDALFRNWRRGFLETLELSMWEFRTCAGHFFTRQPITRVELTDKTPYEYRAHGHEGKTIPHAWIFGYPTFDRHRHGDYPHLISMEVFRFLSGHDGIERNTYGGGKGWASKEDALGALSRACVDYGRDLAKLPELEWRK